MKCKRAHVLKFLLRVKVKEKEGKTECLGHARIVSQSLTGEKFSKNQASRDPDSFFNLRWLSCLAVDMVDGSKVLYFEQAFWRTPHKPFRQRFCTVKPCPKEMKCDVEKLDRSTGYKHLMEYASHFGEVIADGVIWENEELVPGLSELIRLGFLVEFDVEAVEFLLKTKNLQIFLEDQEYLSSKFSS